ncbi:hypothetical protein [Anaplasma marginale]|uniref:hypothetical protein n=1 Tax=Anaplasma marginale TaxID=770 RepID=UPI0005B3E392|nr:hypothetical protein [Anaplasma marginale]
MTEHDYKAALGWAETAADFLTSHMGNHYETICSALKLAERWQRGNLFPQWQPIETLNQASVKQKKRFDVWVKLDNGKEGRVTDCYWHKKAECIMGINPVRQTALYWTPILPPREAEN